MEEELNAYKFLLDEISDEEIASLECPTYESQVASWESALEKVTESNVEILLKSIGLRLVEFGIFPNAKGAMQKIYLVKATALDDDDEKAQKELILRIFNPHKFLEKRRCQNEVAIMSHLKKFTSIPVPMIYSFSYEKSESILGCEFILMERVPGVPLGDITMEAKSVDVIPDKLIDQIMTYVKELNTISTRNMNTNKIGFFDLDMNIVGWHFNAFAACNTFFEHINSQLKWSIKEIRKVNKYAPLADELEMVRGELSRVVEANPDLDSLNFGDEMGIYHGDLHAYNVLVDPDTCDITGIIDWDFCMHGYEFVQMELRFVEDWFVEDELRREMTKRVDEYDAPVKRELMRCFENSRKGEKYRNQLLDLATRAYMMVFYCSSWFSQDECEPGLAVRVLMNQRAISLQESLVSIHELIAELWTYTSELILID